MAVWSWKKSGWVNSTLAGTLIIAVISGICSTGIRTKFQELPTSFKFYGGLRPEIGVFNMLLYISSLFGFVSVALRYSYIVDQNQVMTPAIGHLNKISVSVGILSFLGLLLIASFPVSLQEKDTFQSTGAYIFIGLGIVFTLLQTVLTYSNFKFSTIFLVRACLVVVLMSTFISSVVLIEKNKGGQTLPYSNSTIIQSNDTETISNNTKVNHAQLIACTLEWTSVVVYAFYFLSFVQEFHTISTYIILRPFITPSTNDFRSSSLTINERV